MEKKDGERRYGLNLWDRAEGFGIPTVFSVADSLYKKEGIPWGPGVQDVLKKMNQGKPISADRMFVGKNFEDQVGLFIKDQYGNERITIYVDQNDQPRVEFLDEEGEVVELED